MSSQGKFVPEFPKPFDFVPFAGKPARNGRPGHESFRIHDHFSGRLVYTLHVETPLHISSGNYALTEDLELTAKNVLRDVYRLQQNGQNLPAIPGSTLKGATRAVVEAVTASCIGVTRVDRRDLPDDLERPCRAPHLCPACALYGAMSRMARLSFSDAIFVTGGAGIVRMPALFRPRPEQGRAYRKGPRQFVGRKFYLHGRPTLPKEGHYLEVIRPGSQLCGMVDFTSLTEAELGLLFFALGLDNSFQLALGGGKPVAMGRVHLEPVELQLQQTASFTNYETDSGFLTDSSLHSAITHHLQEAESLILPAQQQKLREILNPQNPRPAATGTY